MLITEFYKNKELFITGGTGYLGKSFLEKLLRDCPDVSKIYLLIRQKKNKSPLERLKEFSKDLIFERLHREHPRAFDKIIPISGDSIQLGLGISPEDLERLKNVNIVIHGAANVRFDNFLRSSILMNTRGTHELLKIAVTLKKLIAFVHVSTAYVNPFVSYVKEQMFDAPVDWRTAVKIAETYDDETLEILRIKYTGFPNAYSFSKNLSENVVAEFADRLPITILRPSIVAQSVEEPEPGFIDNLNGPMSVFVGIGVGLAQVTYCNPDLVMALIPVDTVTILTIVAIYRRGLETLNSKKCGLDIRNLTPGHLYQCTLQQIGNIFVKNICKEPFEQTLWSPTGYMTDNFYIFMTCVFLVNIPLALVYDALLTLQKKKKMVMKVTRQFVGVSKILTKFSHQYFDFQNDGMWELINIIPEIEKNKFDDDYIRGCIDMPIVLDHLRDGVKKFVLKQPIKASPSAHRRYKTVVILDKILKVFIFLLTIKLLWRLVN